MKSPLLTALACWATGLVAVLATADSNQIAAIFPPAGIGIAAALVAGPRALAGVFLGTLAMALSLEPLAAAGIAPDPVTAIVAGLVGAGQAALGAALVRRLLPAGSSPPAEPRRLVELLVLAGPATCLVSAAASTALLLASGHVPADRIIAAGYRLWVADTLGVAVFLPLGLALAARPRPDWRPLLLTAGLPMLLAGLVIAAAMIHQERADLEASREDFARQSTEAARGLLDQIDEVQLILDATHGHLEASEEVVPAEFLRFTAPLIVRSPAIQAIGVSWYVRPDERDEFLRRQRELHGPQFRILARGEDNTLVPAEPAGDAMVISLIEPLQLNQRALGVDTLSVPEAAEPIHRTLRTGFQTATSGFRLAQSPDAGLGIVIYKGVDERGLPAAQDGNPEFTRPAGVAFVAFEIDALAQASFEGLVGNVRYCILDVTEATPRVLGGNGACHDASEPAASFARPLEWRGEIPMAGRTLELQLEAGANATATAVAMARAAAMFGALTLAAFLLSVAGRNAEVARLVERRTSELADEMKIRRRVTAALARSEQRLRTLLGSTAAGIVEMNPDRRIVRSNAYFSRLVGLREPDMIGRHLSELVHPDERDAESSAWSGVATLAVDQLQRRFRLLREDGSTVSVDAAISPIRDARGRVVRMVAVIQDLSEAEQRAMAEMAREKAEAASRAKTEFVARMSHELRTPLNALLGFAQLLSSRPDEPLSDGQAEAVRIIEQSGWHLLDMIDDLLELSRIEAGHVSVQVGRIDLEPIIAESLHLVGMLGSEQGIRVSTHIDESARHVIADPTRLRQVLVNLLSNAIKYNRPGGTVRIEVERAVAPHKVALRVRDTGTGIDAQQLVHLFEPFNRLGRDDTIPGTGIGLVIARNLVELMDGTLEAASQPGRGSCFTVTLPLGRAPQTEAAIRPLGRATAH